MYKRCHELDTGKRQKTWRMTLVEDLVQGMGVTWRGAELPEIARDEGTSSFDALRRTGGLKSK